MRRGRPEVSREIVDGNFYHVLPVGKYRKNRDGYWNAERMMADEIDVLGMVDRLYPDHRPVCFFDSSSYDDNMKPGATVVKHARGCWGSRKIGKTFLP